MRPVERLKNGRRLALLVGDSLIFAVVLAVVFALRGPSTFSLSVLTPFWPVWFCLVVSAYAAGLYEFRVIRDFVSLIGGLLGSALTTSLFASTYFYLFAPYLSFAPKVTLLVAIVCVHAVMFVWRRSALFATGFNLFDLNILILGEPGYSLDLRSSLDERTGARFNVVEKISDGVDLVVVDRAWSDRNANAARATLTAAIAGTLPIVSVTDFHEAAFGRVSPQHANDLSWALDHVLPRSGSLYFTAKRFCDVTVALVLLVVFAPVMLLMAIAIWLSDGNPPLYGQERVGYLGRQFKLWKFRTMQPDAEAHGPFMKRLGGGNSKITAFGGLLRRLRIDELPQLWNVLRGDMSLVGPRPEWVKEVEILETLVPTYSLRYLVPPGITGWAQVYYRATDNAADAIEKHNYDLYYLKHFSLALDLSILLKTMKRVFVKDRQVPSTPAPTPPLPMSRSEGLDIACIVDRS